MSQSTRLRPDAEACQSHSAAHRDGSLAPNPPAGLVPKDHPPTRSRRGSGGVRVLAAVACLAWLAWPTEAFAQQVTLNVDAVAGDNKINQSEHRNAIAVSGNTGTESGVTVEVTIGGTPLTSVTSAMNAMWSVNVKPSAAYITETSVELSVTATKTGFTSATVTRTLPVDLTPPSVSYTAPSSLTVGVLITPIAPTTSDTDIVSYATSGGSLPLGLVLNGATGLISGEPRTANTNTQTVGVLVTDDAGNVDRPQIRFPAVELAAGGVTFSPTALFVPEGGSAGYTVVLDAQPTDDVTITVTRGPSGDEDLTATPNSLTFTDSNWDTPQTVTVSAAEDADGRAGIASFRHDLDSLDDNYKSIPLGSIRVTEVDSDKIGVTVSPQRLMVLEGGSAGYTVVLNTQPTDDVTVEANPDQESDDDLTVSSDTDMDTRTDSVTLTFTDSNWDTPQTVTVSAAEDADESNGTATFSHNVVSLYTFDDDYADEALTIDPVTATEVDADIEPEVAITSNATGPVSGPFKVTITFSEPVEGFEREDIKIRNGTVVDFTEVSSSEYRITITPAQAGRPVAITISENVAEDGHGNGNQAAFFLIGVVLQVSYEEESYTATEGGETVTVTVKLSLGWKEELAIPIRVRRPETTEVSDYTVEGLEGWEAEEGVGKLIIGAGETEGSFKIQANSDGDGDDETVELGFGELPKRVMTGKPAKATLTLKDKGLVEATEVDAEIEPEVAITSNATGPVSGPFEVTITFSEPVEGFEREDIKIRNGTVVDFTEVSSSEYRITITPAQAGRPVAITISENVAEDGHGNGNQAAFFLIGVVLQVSYEEESYTATEGGETVTVTVKLSLGWKEELAIPIRVRRPETTEVSDYTVEGLEGWEAEEGVGKLIIGAGETEGSFKIQANSDGDGDDETVELGFGELPKRVMTGKPAKATLTLKDKGLVELKVSFGQAEYQIKEGHQADIEVTISPAADRRVEVPLEVALEGGATPEDYSGVPASVVFEEGESQGTISVEALADEENDPGEGIVLSLGGLPEAVSAGDPSSTQVHFRQQRTAEQFSRTLEVMLAVIARSTAESAQTAIEGRFERHRQLSRMGSSGGAMQQAPKPGTSEAARGGAPASSHSGTGLGPEESAGAGRGSIDDTGSRGEEGPVEPGAWVTAKTRPATGWGWDLESQQRGTQGSWLRNFSLGGLGSIARSGQTHSGVSTGYGMGPSGTGGGGSLLESTLSRTSFELSLGEQEKEKGKNWVPVLWVQGDLLRFNGDLTRLRMNYRGGLKAAHVGLDLYANDQMLSGLSFMRSWGDMDYTDDGLDGVLDSRMNTVHPYLYWQPNERVSVWGIGGLGRGQVDVTEPSRTHDFDADFRMFAGGVRSVLTRRGNNEWGLRADAFTAQLETDASEGIAQVSGEAHRGRLMLEWVHDRELSAGRSLNLKAEAGGRFDGGDAERGSGVETGVGLGYLDANRGLDVSLHGRVLVVHESDYRDWGVGVQASWDPGEKQRGFRVSVNSSLGQDGGGRTTLWDNADAVMHPAGMGAMGIGSQYRMESEVAYAGLEARGVPGLLTPYSRLRRAGQGRELALGTQWSLPTRSQQALPLMLELEAMRRENRTGPADLGVLLRVSIPLGGSRDVISGRDRVSTQAPDRN